MRQVRHQYRFAEYNRNMIKRVKDSEMNHLGAIGSKSFMLAILMLVPLIGTSFAYNSDKLYHYKLNGTITKRIASDPRDFPVGVLINSPVLLKKTGNDELTIKLEKPEWAVFQGQLTDQISEFDFKLMDQTNSLGRAFKIYLDNQDGSVKAFDSFKDEPKWVSNFKRGLLSFFQLKLLSQNEQTNPPSISNNAQYFTTPEKSVFGECDTDYLVLNNFDPSGSTDSETQTINVTKTRNLAKCRSRFMYKQMNIDSTECSDNEKETHQFKRSNAVFNYNLIGNKKNYYIDEAILDEGFTSTPFGLNYAKYQADTNFKLKLQSIESDEPLNADSGAIRIDSLAYEPHELINFYANVNLEDAHNIANLFQFTATVDQVMEKIDKLVKEQRAYVGALDSSSPSPSSNEPPSNYLENSQLGLLFVEVREQLATVNLSKLESIYNLIEERGDAHKRIFWDLMSVTVTNPSFVFMKKMITEGDAPGVRITNYLTRLSYQIRAPSKALFDEYVNLCKSDKIQGNREYKRLCSLPLASLIHQHCAKPHAKFMRLQSEGGNATHYKKGQNTCQMATADEYFSRLVQTFAPSNSVSGSSSSSSSSSSETGSSSDEMPISEKMFNIKMASEFGVKPSIEFLTDVIRNKNEHPTLRAAALWGMLKANKIYPNIVKKLVAPILYDQSELLEVRLAAFHNWYMSGFSLHELETLAKRLEVEPNRQLVVYIYTLMESIGEIDWMPCGQSSEKMVRLVLPSIKRAYSKHVKASFGDSHAKITSEWQHGTGYGDITFYSAIYGDDSFAPSNIMLRKSEVMFGNLKLTPMAITVQSHGLDKLIKRVIGINGLLSDKQSFMDVFSLKRRNRRQTTTRDLIKQESQEIDKELKLSTREFSDVYLALTVYAYGRPVTFIDKDSNELKRMLSEDGTIKIPNIKKLLHSFNNHTTQQMLVTFENMELFNNEVGLPLYQWMLNFNYNTFKLNSVKFDIEPGFFKEDRQGKPPTRMTASLDAKMGRHQEFWAGWGSLNVGAKQQIGVGYHKKRILNVPIKMTLDANLAEQKITIKRQPIFENFVFIKQEPVYAIRSYDPSNQKLLMVPLYNSSNESGALKSFKFDYMVPLAVGIRAEGKVRPNIDVSLSSVGRKITSTGLKALQFLTSFSPSAAPFELRLSTETTKNNPTNEVSLVLSWRHYRGSEPDSADRELELFTKQSSDSDKKPSTVHYDISLIGGSEKERKVSLSIGYSRSYDHSKHNWRVAYQRTPLNQYGDASEATNLCWTGRLQFSKYDISKWLNFDLLNTDHSANMSTDLTFGDQCSLDSAQQAKLSDQARISMDTKFSWSKEQRNSIESLLNGLKSSKSSPNADPMLSFFYEKCMEQRKKSDSKLDPNCIQALLKISELNHVESNIDYHNVPERWSQMLSKLGSLYTSARSSYLEEMDEKSNNREQAHLEANLTTDSFNRKLSYELNTPNYHALYRGIPFSLPPLSTFPLAGGSYYQMVQRRAGHRFCSVSGQSVTTFDNLTYTMPQTSDGCFKLITKDCSPENNFIVLGAEAGTSKVVKIYVANKFKVEFVPAKDGKGVGDIKVNGESVKIEPNEKPLTQSTQMGPNTRDAFSIENNGAYYTLNSKMYAFSVSTDGNWIFIQQSKYYAGKSCGICGDADGNQLLEFKSPSSARRVCKTSHDFVWSHVIPSTCASRPVNVEC